MSQSNSTEVAEKAAAAIAYVTWGGATAGSAGGGGPVPWAHRADVLLSVHRGEAVVPKAEKDLATRQKVEILFNGVRRLVFVNGRQVRQVLSIETPRSVDEMAGIVELKFIASEIVEREISQEQFDALMKS